jgi:hypothetical protein
MRPYPRNSPEAAARIVALALLADGNLTDAELKVLSRQDAYRQLGLSPRTLHTVLQHFCEDLLSSVHLTWSEACRIDPKSLVHLLAEVEDPALRRRVLRLCLQVVDADDHIAAGEAIVLDAAVEHWGLQHAMFDRLSPDRANAPC